MTLVARDNGSAQTYNKPLVAPLGLCSVIILGVVRRQDYVDCCWFETSPLWKFRMEVCQLCATTCITTSPNLPNLGVGSTTIDHMALGFVIIWLFFA